MAGKLIVLEGTDGSGKSTQFARLCRRLEEEGRPFHRIVFPQYKEPSSALVRMYLGGEFGAHPGDVNAYAASTFFAVDRYASYRKVWGDYYREGGLVLADRYTTSTAVHQAGKRPRSSGRSSSAGCTTWSSPGWGCPPRTWCSIWTCPPPRRWKISAAGRRPPTPTATSTRWTPPIWPPAGRRLCWPPGPSGGPPSPACGTAGCARWRTSTGRSGTSCPPI